MFIIVRPSYVVSGFSRTKPTKSDDRLQLSAALPESRHRAAELFIRDVQVPLRLLDVGVPEHQLDRADVHSVGEEPAGSFVTKISARNLDSQSFSAVCVIAIACPRCGDRLELIALIEDPKVIRRILSHLASAA
jgi:hypothetical protein